MTTKRLIILGLSLGVILTPFDIFFQLYTGLILCLIIIILSGILFAQVEQNKALNRRNETLLKEIKPLHNHIVALEKELAKYERIAIATAVHDIPTYTALLEKNKKEKSKQKKQNNQD